MNIRILLAYILLAFFSYSYQKTNYFKNKGRKHPKLIHFIKDIPKGKKVKKKGYYIDSINNSLKELNQRIYRSLPKLPDFTDQYYYKSEDAIRLLASELTSRTLVPFNYKQINLCTPTDDKLPSEGISELLTGKRNSYTNYFVYINVNETCVPVCNKKFEKKDVNYFKWLIKRKYEIHYTLDNLPAGYQYYINDFNKNIPKNVTGINHFRGIPLGFVLNDKFYLYNHYVINVYLNKKKSKYQIVDFNIQPFSVKQKNNKKCMFFANINKSEHMVGEIIDENVNNTRNNNTGNITKINNNEVNTSLSYDQIEDKIYNTEELDLNNLNDSDNTEEIIHKNETHENKFYIPVSDERYYQEAEYQELTEGNIGFTFDVVFHQSNKTFSSRWDRYFTTNKHYRWLGLIYSNFLIFAFSFIVFTIIVRIVKRDVDKYNTNIMSADNVYIGEYDWKQINGDVFRRPKHLMLLSAFVGTGTEMVVLFILGLFFSIVGFIKPEVRASFLNYIIYSFFLLGIVSGYVSTFIYKTNGARQWVLNSIITAFLFPFLALIVLGISRLLFTFERSSASIKIGDFALLILLWLFVSSPLVFFGSFLCARRAALKLPCKINSVPTALNPKAWYLHLQYAAWFTGIIPFATIFIEFIYIISYLWRYQVYYTASFLGLSVFFLVVLSSEISIIFVFINLCKGDYNWWWKSFFVSASPAVYIFAYSVYYFFYMKITRLTAIVVYFLIMGLITIISGLVSGSCGTLITFLFVYYIYSQIKID